MNHLRPSIYLFFVISIILFIFVVLLLIFPILSLFFLTISFFLNRSYCTMYYSILYFVFLFYISIFVPKKTCFHCLEKHYLFQFSLAFHSMLFSIHYTYIASFLYHLPFCYYHYFLYFFVGLFNLA